MSFFAAARQIVQSGPPTDNDPILRARHSALDSSDARLQLRNHPAIGYALFQQLLRARHVHLVDQAGPVRVVGVDALHIG